MSIPNEVSATQAARMLGIRCDYITMLLRSGKLEGRKVDGQWVVPVAAIEQRLKQLANDVALINRANSTLEDRALVPATA